MQLTSIAENVDNPRLEQFCLYFRGPVSPILAQCTHTLEHEKLGVIQLFIVPIGLDAEGARYEVVFNRIRPVSVAGSR